jgi:V/A-type H+-transporting ATPase subunit I
MSIVKMKFVSISGAADTLDAVTMRCLLSGNFQPETSTELLSGSGYYRINEENPYASNLARITDAVKSSGREPVFGTEIIPDKKSGRESYYNRFSQTDNDLADIADPGSLIDRLPSAEEIVRSIAEDTKPENGQDTQSSADEGAPEIDKLRFFEALDAETAGLWAAKYINQRIEDISAENQADNSPGGDPLLVSYDRSIQKIEKVISALRDELKRLESELDKYKDAIEQLEHFKSLDVDLGELWSAKFLKLRFGRMPVASAKEIDAYDKNPYVEFFRCSESNGYSWGMYVAPVSAVDEVDRIFAALFFERLRIPDITGRPADAIRQLTDEYNKTLENAEKLKKKIKLFWDAEYDSCMRVCAKLYRLSEAFNLRRAAARNKDGYLLFGWVPEKEAGNLAASFDELRGIEMKLDSPKQIERFSPPTKLKNPRFMRPYEFLVSMFGMPSYDEFDPTPLVALTYTLFYGIMFADLGQGLVLALAGWLMGRFMRNRLGPILVRCGISGALFGLLFGSVFGYEHALDGFYRMLGFDGKPIEVMESSSIATILISAIGIGVLLLVVAIILNIFISLRKAEFSAALFGTNGVAGLVLYIGLILLVLGFVVDIPVPTVVIVWLMIVLPCLLIMLGEPLSRLVAREKHWMPEKWGEYLIGGIFELFESILSYMTNTVSFIRVGAFVLVHAGMMMVFLTVAEMVGGGVAGVIVMIIGNLLVIALEGLLVGVQSLRLEYYELFSRFFAGTGKEFKPAGISALKN